jgi:hypothetical protein
MRVVSSQSTPLQAATRPRLNVRAGWASAAVGATLIALAYATLRLSGSTVNVLVEEDGWFEWLGAIGLFAGSALFLAGFFVARRAAAASGARRLLPWTLLALSVVLFVGGGEEISWGQRILGWGTPEGIGGVNAQGETNLHNMQTFHGLIDMDRLFTLGSLVLFVAVPIMAWASPRWRARLSALLPVAPLWVAALFIVNLAFRHIAAALEAGSGSYTSIYSAAHAASEISEGIAEVLMAVAALLALRALHRAGRAGPFAGERA